MIELLPCPFCGAQLTPVQPDGTHFHDPTGCLLDGFELGDVFADDWNTRTLVAKQPIAPYKVEP